MQSSSKKLAKKPNLILIVVDALRNDHVLGKSSAKTPFLDILREKSTVFTQAVCATTSTTPGLVSLLTGCYSFKHGFKRRYDKVEKPLKTLVQALKEKGYYTIAEIIDAKGIYAGLGSQAFDEYNTRVKEKELIYAKWGNDLIARLKEKKVKQPFFLFLHLWVTHRPRYMEKRFNKRKYGKVAYQRSMSCLDFHLERLFGAFGNNTVVVLTGDHGEKIPGNKAEEYFNNLLFYYYYLQRRFDISGKYPSRESHGFGLTEELVRIPLLFYGNGFQAKAIGQQVSQVDIPVTVAKILNLNLQNDFDGIDLMPLVKGRQLQEKPAFIESRGDKMLGSQNWIEGIRTSKWKYLKGIFNKSIPLQLYDLQNDAEEKRNLASERPDVVKEMKAVLESMKRNALPEKEVKE